MADFLDKMIVGINKGVSSVSEGSRAMVEKAKINTAISDAEKTKAQLAQQLGSLTHQAQQNGLELPENLLAVCGQITACNDRIAELKNRLSEMEAAKAAAQVPAPEAVPTVPVCPSCGTAGRPGGKFCAKCGTALQ
ncbi:MAG: hypothetical protein IJN25_07715 [Clostridia bacterium]|nr:hypothetical protein [Clostridia bacterium]